jgi:hypothetical protein
MAEDLLDYWVRLIKTIFPADAWINSLLSNDDYLIQVDWNPRKNSGNPARRSKIVIIIKDLAINDYLDKNKSDREISDSRLAEFICGRYDHFISDDPGDANRHASTEKWLISRDVINRNQGVPVGGEI